MTHDIRMGDLIKFNETTWAAYYTRSGPVNYKVHKGVVSIVLGYQPHINKYKSEGHMEVDILLDNRRLTVKVRPQNNLKFDILHA